MAVCQPYTGVSPLIVRNRLGVYEQRLSSEGITGIATQTTRTPQRPRLKQHCTERPTDNISNPPSRSGVITQIKRDSSPSLDTGLVFGLLAGGRGIGNVISMAVCDESEPDDAIPQNRSTDNAEPTDDSSMMFVTEKRSSLLIRQRPSDYPRTPVQC
jgi:hypothetical protein